MAWLRGLFVAARARSGLFDHAVRAGLRYGDDNGGRLAAAITLPAFLSFFPLVALALSIAGFVAHYDHHAQQEITAAISGFFPGLIGNGEGQIDVAKIADQRTATGVIGLVGLLIGGLGWIAALRATLRAVWHQPKLRRNPLLARAQDATVLVGVGLVILASLAITAMATAAAQIVVDHSPISSGGVEWSLRVVVIALAIGADVMLFGYLYLRLGEPGKSYRHVLAGAVLAALAFEILKSGGAIYIAHVTHNPLYAGFAVIVGLLVWVNLVAQVYLFGAVWAVTGPYATDQPPSGTAGVGVGSGEVRMHASDGGRGPVPISGETEGEVPGIAVARFAGGAALGLIGAVVALVARYFVRSVRIALRPDEPR